MNRLSSYGFTPRSEGSDTEASSSGEQPDNQQPKQSRVSGTATTFSDRKESDNYNIILLLIIMISRIPY